jgi:hypothetical protein
MIWEPESGSGREPLGRGGGKGGEGRGFSRPILAPGLQKSIKLEHHRRNYREAYLIAGSGSATDGATLAARHKMATAVDARIVSDVVKVVEI